MAPTQTNPQPAPGSSCGNSQDIAPPYEPGSLCYNEERVVEQTDDMNWAIDVLSPTSQASVWDKYVANGMLVLLAQQGATAKIKQLSATVLANSARVVS